jgi:hypothetical protein
MHDAPQPLENTMFIFGTAHDGPYASQTDNLNHYIVAKLSREIKRGALCCGVGIFNTMYSTTLYMYLRID